MKGAVIVITSAILFVVALIFLHMTVRPCGIASGIQKRSYGVVKQGSDYYKVDKIVGHVHRAYARREYIWPEHKNGKVVLKTNNLGLREDSDTRINKPKGVIRVLVTGDSHIDGVVNNDESFPHVLQAKLNAANQTAKFEILNGGVGYYGFEQYFFFLKKYSILKPDVFIAVIYTGNDFIEATAALESEGEPNKRSHAYKKRLQNYSGNANILYQAMNQIYYFKSFPEMKEKAVAYALEIILKINNLCRQRNIDFICVFLPTKADVEWQSDRNNLEKVRGCLDLSEPELKINRELTEALIKGISENHINFIDLYHDMKNQDSEFFWKKDYHLNVEGHKFLAEKIYEKYHNFLKQNRTKD